MEKKTITEKSSGEKFTLGELLKLRKDAVDVINIWQLQAVNELILKYARKYKLSYYSL